MTGGFGVKIDAFHGLKPGIGMAKFNEYLIEYQWPVKQDTNYSVNSPSRKNSMNKQAPDFFIQLIDSQ